MERRLKVNTILKTIACSCCFLVITFTILLFSASTFEPNLALIISFVLIAMMLTVMLAIVYPVVFKEYITQYWKEKEGDKILEKTS